MILCSNYFRPVYEEFADGNEQKEKKIQRLLDYCLWQEQMDDLLAAVKKANPRKYQQFEGRLTESV